MNRFTNLTPREVAMTVPSQAAPVVSLVGTDHGD